MKTQTFSEEEILNGCDRNHDALIDEIYDRIKYVALQANGKYRFCSESPMEMDILRMVTRLCIKRIKNRSDYPPYCEQCKTDAKMIKHSDGKWVCHGTHILSTTEKKNRQQKGLHRFFHSGKQGETGNSWGVCIVPLVRIRGLRVRNKGVSERHHTMPALG